MRRVLVIDGGGVKGFIPLQVLVALEAKLGRPLCECFDVVLGTSVGAILGALVASGKLPAAQIQALMRDVCPKMFTRRPWPLLPKYSREPFRKAWREAVGDGMALGDCRSTLIVTAVNECDGQTHYFKSDDPKDRGMKLRSAVEYSFAAPMYFGGMEDKARQAVWLDGGTGIDNCPLLEGVYEVVHRGWLNSEPVHILSLGCGHFTPHISYDRACRWFGKTAREVGIYMSPGDGGLARRQAIRDRVSLVLRLDEVIPNLTFQRLDCELPEKLDTMDNIKAIPQYEEYGRALATILDTRPFAE